VFVVSAAVVGAVNPFTAKFKTVKFRNSHTHFGILPSILCPRATEGIEPDKRLSLVSKLTRRFEELLGEEGRS
jgi:hypothetical protein